MAFLFLFFTVALSLCVVGLIVLALASILGSVRDDWKLKNPNENRVRETTNRFSTDLGGGKRRGDFIVASVVNNKPQMSADYFSMLQFIGSNLAFAATVLHRTKNAALRANLAGRLDGRPLFYHPLAAGSGGRAFVEF